MERPERARGLGSDRDPRWALLKSCGAAGDLALQVALKLQVTDLSALQKRIGKDYQAKKYVSSKLKRYKMN